MSTHAEPPDKLEWETPPPHAKRAGSKWDPIARTLKANPGRWACIGRSIPTNISSTIRRGELKCWKPAGAFEVRTVNHTERWVADVYVRYVGEDQEHA
jgi:hypothetical protein